MLAAQQVGPLVSRYITSYGHAALRLLNANDHTSSSFERLYFLAARSNVASKLWREEIKSTWIAMGCDCGCFFKFGGMLQLVSQAAVELIEIHFISRDWKSLSPQATCVHTYPRICTYDSQ